MLEGPVGHEPLEGADGHGLPFLAPDAEPLALRLLGADPPGDAGQGVVIEERLGSAREVALGQQLDEARDVDADRAAIDAAGVAAIEAALGLLHGQHLRVAEADLTEVHRPDDRRAGRHLVALDAHALLRAELRAVGHEALSACSAS
jgi:hypothetical protein